MRHALASAIARTGGPASPEYGKLAAAVQAHIRDLERLGMEDADVAGGLMPSVDRGNLRIELAMLTPLAALGAVHNAPVALGAKFLSRRVKNEVWQATTKGISATLLCPVVWAFDFALLNRRVGDANAWLAVDEEQLSLQCSQTRRALGEKRTQHRPDPELLGAVTSQCYFGDAAFDHLDPNPSISDVLRGDDCPAQVKAGRPIEVADRTRDRREVGLGDFPSEISLIGPDQLRPGYRLADVQNNIASMEGRFGIGSDSRPRSLMNWTLYFLIKWLPFIFGSMSSRSRT